MRAHRIAAAAVALALVAGACDTGSDDADVEADLETEADLESEADLGTDVDGDAEFDEDSEEDVDDGDPVDLEELSDAEFAAFLNQMSSEEFNDFTADYSDEEYNELIDFLDAQDTDGDGDDEAGGDTVAEDEATIDDANDAAAPTATRDDVDCSAEGLGADDTFEFTVAHTVVEGQLGAVCFGEADERVVDAWNALATISPAGQLADIGLFGGFEATEEGDAVTLAFVNTLDADGTLFQMSINLQTQEEDPAEAQLTMAHELTHVFTALPSQIDRTDEAIDDCPTYFNGEGCYAPDSIMYQWITEFWDDGLIDEVDPNGEATAEAGQARCDDDSGFFGAYGASNPEEDFAESFSAFVFDIETFGDQSERIDWIAAQPGLAEFRDRAVAAGVETPPNNFDECGLG
ncbi:MAG: hypothetical protein AB8G14_07555 [Ilumatobacter sp.]